MKRYMLAAVASFFCLFFMAASSLAEETVISLLDSEDWHDKSEAVSVILKDISRFNQDAPIKSKILSAFSDENERLKELRRSKIVNPEPGRGEYYINLLDLVIRMDVRNATNLLIDNADLGIKVEDAIVKRMTDNDGKDLQVLQQMKKKFFSEDGFYRSKRGSYLRINYKYIEKKKGNVDQERKQILRQFIKKGLTANDFIEKQYAIRSSKYFDDDQEIAEKIRRISIEDKFIRMKDGAKSYPLKEEADRIMKKWHENEQKERRSPSKAE